MPVAADAEMRARRRVEGERVRDGAAVHCQMMGRRMVGCRGAGVEVEAAQVEDVVPAEGVDRVAEVVTGQGRVLDLERLPTGGEGDVAGAGRPERGEVKRTAFQRRAAGIGVAGAAELQRAMPDLDQRGAGAN